MTRAELMKAVKKIKAETEEEMYYMAWELANENDLLYSEDDMMVTFYADDYTATFGIYLKNEWFYGFKHIITAV